MRCDGRSVRFSYLMSNILSEVCYGETVCNSTEEMLAAIEECNRTDLGEDFVIGSADVEALYPSIILAHHIYSIIYGYNTHR